MQEAILQLFSQLNQKKKKSLQYIFSKCVEILSVHVKCRSLVQPWCSPASVSILLANYLTNRACKI